MWNTDSQEMSAVIMTLQDKPQAVLMSFQKEYAESYEWITTVFSDWAFTFVTSFLYYQDYDALEEAERNVYRKGIYFISASVSLSLPSQLIIFSMPPLT